jgi:hypothetical protein
MSPGQVWGRCQESSSCGATPVVTPHSHDFLSGYRMSLKRIWWGIIRLIMHVEDELQSDGHPPGRNFATPIDMQVFSVGHHIGPPARSAAPLDASGNLWRHLRSFRRGERGRVIGVDSRWQTTLGQIALRATRFRVARCLHFAESLLRVARTPERFAPLDVD